MSALKEPTLESMAAGAGIANGVAAVPGAGARLGMNGSVTPARKRRPMVLVVLLLVVAIGATYAAVYAVHAARYQSTDDAFIEGRVITISPQVSARVKKVLVDDNNPVVKDQPLVELDDIDYQVAKRQADATLVAMKGKAQQADSEIEEAIASANQARAEVDVTIANSKNAEADYNRFTELKKKNEGAVSRQQMDVAIAAWTSNNAQVKQAQAKLENANAVIATKRATAVAADGDVQKAQADVRKAEVNLSYCVIRAPESGKITRKNVEPGSYVQTGEQLLAIVPNEMWVVANFKETQLEKMRLNQPVTISVDAYPGLELHGRVDSFQSGTGSRFSMLPAENATGNFVKVVQRIPVKILVTEKNSDVDRVLSPGMSVLPEVDVRQQ